jgi:antitoxin component YwqK of YwqJK toxin-antitoxin module
MKKGPITLERSWNMKRAINNEQTTNCVLNSDLIRELSDKNNEERESIPILELDEDVLRIIFMNNLPGFIAAKQVCVYVNKILPTLEDALIKYAKHIVEYDEDGEVTLEETRVCGVLHDIKNDAAHTSITYENGEIKTIEHKHYNRGKLHRVDGPAWYKRENGRTVYKAYYVNGVIHRDGRSAETKYRYFEFGCDPSVELKYYRMGLLHNSNGPAWILASKCGRLSHRFRKYYVNGVKHRDGGKPALTRYVMGDKTLKWYENGVLIRKTDIISH